MKKRLILLILVVISFNGCSVIKQIANLSKLKFKLGSVGNFRLAGIDINNKASYSDFNVTELMKLTSLFTEKKLPAVFTLNLEAQNPNGNTEYTQAPVITLKSLPWTLYLDDKETISGNIGQPVQVQGNNSVVTIPLDIQFDLLKVFQDGSLQNIAKLVLSVGGVKKDLTKVKLTAQPVIDTPLGEMTYPERLTIVNTEFK
ncbi:MAG: hypothetical protein GXX85_17120 [Ignavibacteria bacterium]|nr:hypothetical protein [Ignavibacteria bacterium]